MRFIARNMRFMPQVIAVAVLAALTSGLSPAQTVQKSSVSDTAVARGYPEVRMRKMHMVRPDLIPYPVYFDIYC